MSPDLNLLSVMKIFGSKWSFGSGEITYQDKSKLGPRRQEDLQLVYLLEGDISISVDGHCYQLAAGEVTLLLPGAIEVFHFAAHGLTRHGWCRASAPSFDTRLLQRLGARPERLPLTGAMRALTDAALPLHATTDPALATYRDALIVAAFYEFLSRCALGEAVPQPPLHPAVERASSFMDTHFSQNIDLVQVAVAARMTPSHLARLFREGRGVTPMRYLWSVRLKQSLQLLRETGLTVAEVSDRCGFSNPQHFSKMFKKESRQTPGEYRASAWQSFG